MRTQAKTVEVNQFADAHIFVYEITACAYENNEEVELIAYVPLFDQDMSDEDFNKSVMEAARTIGNVYQHASFGVHIDIQFSHNYVNC